jgi:hypothetical protein
VEPKGQGFDYASLPPLFKSINFDLNNGLKHSIINLDLMEIQMNKFIVAYFNLLEGELKQELVEANSKFEAAVSYLGWTKEDLGQIKTYDELDEAVFNMDAYINVLELKPNRKSPSRGFPSISTALNN